MWEFARPGSLTKRFYRREQSPIRILIIRITFICILLLVVAWIFWVFEGDHIKDDVGDGDFSYLDSVYFTIISVTTVGYGDIVPITEEARMFDALIITPVRIVVWVLLIGTAYQLVIQNYWERYKMKTALSKMKGHVIVAGFGTTGVATVKELITNGYNENNLIVIDKSQDNVKSAAEAGATGLFGDPSHEELLKKAVIKRARALIITTPHDDANVLISLTAKDMNRNIKIIARVSNHENIKQLKRAGANVIISPSLTGGNLMAMAVEKSTSVNLLSDLLTSSRGVNVLQRKIKASEIGKSPKDLKRAIVLSMVRRGKYIGPRELDGVILEKGDEIILIG
jgi:voltage-gated potassium channel